MMNPEDLYYTARTLFQAGRLPEARVMLEGVVTMEMEPRLAVRVWCLLGTVLRNIGEVGGALEAFSRSAMLLPASGDLAPVMAGTIAYEQGLALWQSQQPFEALEALQEAHRACATCGLRQGALLSLLWQAWILAEAEMMDKAEGALVAGREWATTTEDHFRVTLTEARIALAHRDPNSGQELVDALRRADPADVPTDVLAIACSIAAEAAALRCDWEGADALADMGAAAGRSCPDWRVLHITSRAARSVARMRVGH
jgi:tetratricopeptide (TPR) repeat protein